LIRAFQIADFSRFLEGAAITVAGFDVRSMEEERVVVAPPSSVASKGEGPRGVSVKAGPAGDDLVFVGFSDFPPVLPDKLWPESRKASWIPASAGMSGMWPVIAVALN
jgi:hypothetical protein